MTQTNELLSKVHFTPCFDFIMVDEEVKNSVHRVTPAIVSLVLGRMWRYSKMSGNVSKPAILTIGKHLGIAVKTVERSIKVLEDMHLVTDLDKGRRYVPHAYRVNEIAIMARHFVWVKNNKAEVLEMENTPEEPEVVIVPEPAKIGIVDVRKLRQEMQD